MLKIPYNYSGKEFILTPYNTLQEKDLLLLGMMTEESGDNLLVMALQICGMCTSTIDNLTKEEKIAMLYKYRAISVGEEIHLNFTCAHCKTHSENVINVENVVIGTSKSTAENIKDMFCVVTDDNITDFIDCDVDDMDLDEYEEFTDKLKESVTRFDFEKPIICQQCTKTNTISIDDPEFIIGNMSDETLNTLYQTYNDLVFYGKYSKLDVDSFYPFERTIFVSLLSKNSEGLNQ